MYRTEVSTNQDIFASISPTRRDGNLFTAVLAIHCHNFILFLWPSITNNVIESHNKDKAGFDGFSGENWYLCEIRVLIALYRRFIGKFVSA